jgi:hypothetical protein
MSAEGFAAYEGRKPRVGRCRVCGAPNAGRVQVLIARKDGGTYRLVDSVSGSFCEPCAVKTYEAAKAAFTKPSA